MPTTTVSMGCPRVFRRTGRRGRRGRRTRSGARGRSGHSWDGPGIEKTPGSATRRTGRVGGKPQTGREADSGEATARPSRPAPGVEGAGRTPARKTGRSASTASGSPPRSRAGSVPRGTPDSGWASNPSRPFTTPRCRLPPPPGNQSPASAHQNPVNAPRITLSPSHPVAPSLPHPRSSRSRW